MAPLLTWNGIPPQILGSLNERQRACVLDYASHNKDELYENWQSDLVAPVQAFAKFAAAASSSFTRWGAEMGYNSLRLISSQLETGGATFQGPDTQLHSDTAYARSQKLGGEGFLVLRMLCVSSIPADFIDLTGLENMPAILDQYRQNNNLNENNGGRLYEPSLLTLAHTKGAVLRPKPWDIIIFDGTTPHLPQVAVEPHRRIFQQAWIEMRLPQGWRARVASGDAPQFQLTL